MFMFRSFDILCLFGDACALSVYLKFRFVAENFRFAWSISECPVPPLPLFLRLGL